MQRKPSNPRPSEHSKTTGIRGCMRVHDSSSRVFVTKIFDGYVARGPRVFRAGINVLLQFAQVYFPSSLVVSRELSLKGALKVQIIESPFGRSSCTHSPLGASIKSTRSSHATRTVAGARILLLQMAGTCGNEARASTPHELPLSEL
jgi:hypothetical protein